ncbi:MAG TPA: transposase [Nitrososphaera sp.]|nr:transposase [Nitrososphaera sp.]
MILTYKLKHSKDFSEELSKAKQIAEYAVKTRSNTSADVKHFGLKSMIANQILRKYGRDRKTKNVKHVNLIVPNQGIFVDRALKLIIIPCLKLKSCYHFSGFEKVNQIEIDKEYAYVSVTIPESQNNNNSSSSKNVIGIDLNTRSHIAVVSNPDTGKVWKLGKEANHIAVKYREIRRKLQKAGKYRKVKQLKDRQGRIIRNLNHHISKKIVELAKVNNCGIIKLEELKRIRQRARIARTFRYSLNSWSFYQLQKFVEYKAKLQGIAVSYVDPSYTSQTCSRCGQIGDRYNKSFKCLCGHVDHADANASFNIGKPVSHCMIGIGRLHTDSDVCKGSTDTPKSATPMMMETLEPPTL